MAPFMAVTAKSFEVGRALIAFARICDVVNVEVCAEAAVFAEAARAYDRGDPSLLPAFATKVLPVLALSRLPCRLPLGPAARSEVVVEELHPDNCESEQDQPRCEVHSVYLDRSRHGFKPPFARRQPGPVVPDSRACWIAGKRRTKPEVTIGSDT